MTRDELVGALWAGLDFDGDPPPIIVHPPRGPDFLVTIEIAAPASIAAAVEIVERNRPTTMNYEIVRMGRDTATLWKVRKIAKDWAAADMQSGEAIAEVYAVVHGGPPA